MFIRSGPFLGTSCHLVLPTSTAVWHASFLAALRAVPVVEQHLLVLGAAVHELIGCIVRSFPRAYPHVPTTSHKADKCAITVTVVLVDESAPHMAKIGKVYVASVAPVASSACLNLSKLYLIQ